MAEEPSPSEFLISKMEGMDEIMEQLVRVEQGQVRRAGRQTRNHSGIR
jgi:hypothetical protein